LRLWKKHIRQTLIASGLAAVAVAALTILLAASNPNLVLLLTFSVMVFAVPSFIVSEIRNRWENAISNAFPPFVRAIAENQRMGMNILKALKAAGERAGPLKEEVDIVVRLMDLGMNFEEAFKRFARRLEMPFAYRLAEEIAEAAKYGGDMTLVFDMTAKYAENVLTWEKRVGNEAVEKMMEVYTSFGVYLLVTVIMMTQLIPPLVAANNPMIHSSFTMQELRSINLQTSMILAVTSGLMIGKLGSNKSLSGLKHSIILMIVAAAIFTLFT
jgi:pilus assembly protein TadC